MSAQSVELRGLEADLVVTPETKLTAAGQKVAEAVLGHHDEDGSGAGGSTAIVVFVFAE